MKGLPTGLTWKQLFVRLKDRWLGDEMGDVAGAVTFFAVLALFPFLIFLVALAGVLLTPGLVESIVRSLSEVAPQAVVELVGDRIRALEGSKSVSLLTVSALVAVVSASSGMVALMAALNKAYAVKEQRSVLRKRAIALVMTLLAAAGSLLAGLAAVFLPVVAARLGGPAVTALAWLRLPVAAAVLMLIWAALYWALPDVRRKFQLITPGAVFGVLLWALASWGFSQYVSHFGRYEVTYGALGSVAILLFWMWISAQALLLGAEINAVIEEAKQPRREEVAAVARGEPVPEHAKPPAPPPRHRGRELVVEAGLVGLLLKLFGKARA
jgi:membrane protein